MVVVLDVDVLFLVEELVSLSMVVIVVIVWNVLCVVFVLLVFRVEFFVCIVLCSMVSVCGIFRLLFIVVVNVVGRFWLVN